MVVQSSLRIYTLLSEAPAHFDNCKVASYQVKAVKFKSKNKTRMPRKLWQKGLKYGLSRITKNRCLSNGQENKRSYRLTKEEPIEKESIKARLMANQVA